MPADLDPRALNAPAPQPSANRLPDVAGDIAGFARALDWVGMHHMALPLRIDGDAGVPMQVAADVDVGVDLRDPQARGIHMSRLYMRLQDTLAAQVVSPASLRDVLQQCIESQRGLSTRAKLVLRYAHLLKRRALASDNAGWKAYPVEIEAVLGADGMALTLSLAIDYSSTCPASAALSRQLNSQRFAEDFAGRPDQSVDAITDWIATPRALAATPHAQRSRAHLRLLLRDDNVHLPIVALVDAVEAALGTPVQTAVKREDEQAFARLNAENLLFCEDAARRVAAALSVAPQVQAFEISVAHLESLHAHDAVASVSGRND